MFDFATVGLIEWGKETACELAVGNPEYRPENWQDLHNKIVDCLAKLASVTHVSVTDAMKDDVISTLSALNLSWKEHWEKNVKA